MAALEREELRKVLEHMLNNLEKGQHLKGLDLKDKNKMLDELVKNLTGKIDAQDLKNPQMQKALGVAIIFQAISNTYPHHALDYSKFFEDKRGANKKDLKNDLQQDFKKFMLAINQLNPREHQKINPNKMDEFSDQWSEKLTEKYIHGKENETSLASTKLFSDSVEELYLRSLNGGDTPNISGDVTYPVQGPVFNYVGLVTQHVGATNKDTRTAMDDFGSYNPDKENKAAEVTGLMGALTQGITAIVSPILDNHQKLDQEQSLSGPPRCVPPGTHR